MDGRCKKMDDCDVLAEKARVNGAWGVSNRHIGADVLVRGLELSDIHAGVTWFPPGSSVGPRNVPLYEFGTVLQGRAEWTTDEQQLVLEPGVVHLARPGSQRYLSDAVGVTQHAWVEFQIISGHRLLGPDREWPVVFPLLPRGPLGLLFGYL